MAYAFNNIVGGPAGMRLVAVTNGTSNVLLAWDHSNLSACSYQYPNNPTLVPWPFNDPDAGRHYALRHNTLFNVLWCDGHAGGMIMNDLQNNLFYAN